jgi:hypothetical protein
MTTSGKKILELMKRSETSSREHGPGFSLTTDVEWIRVPGYEHALD